MLISSTWLKESVLFLIAVFKKFPFLKKDIDIESPLEGTLNIGSSSTLYRRESQFPFMSSRLYKVGSIDNVSNIDANNSWWYTAKKKFNTPPSIETEAPTIQYEDACELVDYNDADKLNYYAEEAVKYKKIVDDNLYSVLDEIQNIFDKKKICSEVHMIFKK